MSEQILDLRDLANQWRDLEAELADAHDDDETDVVLDLRADRAKYTELCSDLGIDETPEALEKFDEPALIHEDYFVEYAQDLAEDIGAIGPDLQWPLHYIDWERAADALKMDYTEVRFDGDSYFVRS